MSEVWRELQARLQEAESVAILGVGSPLKTDDAAGMRLIEELQKRGLEEPRHRQSLLLIGGSSAPENFTGVISAFAPDVLVVVDAARLGLNPGEVSVLSPEQQQEGGFSTHMLPISLMLSYLEQLGVANVLMLGIEPLSMEFGLELTPPVQRAVAELADFMAQNIKE